MAVAILADADPPGNGVPDARGGGTMSDAAKAIAELETDNVLVFFAAKTLEYDLALAGNAERMADAYRGVRPEKGAKMVKAVEEAASPENKAKAFLADFDRRDKAKFAQRLSESISTGPDGFQVPAYIAEALAHVVGAGGHG